MRCREFRLLILALTSLILSYQAIDHTEHDQARFVATTGSDKGQCSNPVRPCKPFPTQYLRRIKAIEC